MALKPCRHCKTLVPSHLYVAHLQAHQNTTPAKQRTRTPEWKALREKVLKRDHRRCQKCHRTEASLKVRGLTLHVHHMDDNPNNNQMGNLLTLCEECHPRGNGPQRRANAL